MSDQTKQSSSSGSGTSSEVANGADPGTAMTVAGSSVWTLDVGAPTKEGALGFAGEVSRRYVVLQARTAVDLYDLGTAMNAAQGAGMHEALSLSWEGYLDRHFEIPRSSAYQMQRAARLFTRDQVAALGIGRADALASLPDAERERLLPEAPDMTVRELREAVKELVAVKQPGTALAVPEQSSVAIVHLPSERGTLPLERTGDNHAFGVLRGKQGTALALAIAPDETGELVVHFTAIEAGR